MMDGMRQFVIITPHQSVGAPGTVVSAEQLHMSDGQLDEYVDAGHATEIHVNAPQRKRGDAPPPEKVVRMTKQEDGKSDD